MQVALETLPAPAPAATGIPFFHGTSKAAAGEAILADGYLRAPSAERQDARYGRAFQRPVDGRIYITSSVRYATVYALGGDLLGCDFQRASSIDEPHGYLFQVDGTGLSMAADEDSLGTIPWLLAGLDWAPAPGERSDSKAFVHYCLLHPEYREALTRTIERCLTPHVARKAREGLAVWQSKAGKALLRGLSPELLATTTRLFPHRSAPGPIRWTAAWKLAKGQAKLLRPDGSNVFDIATRIG